MREKENQLSFYFEQLNKFVVSPEKFGAITLPLRGTKEDKQPKVRVIAGVFPLVKHPEHHMYILGAERHEDRIRSIYYEGLICDLKLPNVSRVSDDGDSPSNRALFQIMAASQSLPVVAVSFAEVGGVPDALVSLTYLPGYSPAHALELIQTGAKQALSKVN